ncbi:hypothetical protein ACFLYB_06635 [Chloroflexota bacterium]
MRDFNEASKEKKSKRIQIPNNPDKLSQKQISYLESMIKALLQDGYLPCPVAWEISDQVEVSKIAIGEIADRLGTRITDCQLGFFKEDKTAYDNPEHKGMLSGFITSLKKLKEDGNLSCAMVFEMAQQFMLEPIVISNEASAQGLKINGCQLGCF